MSKKMCRHTRTHRMITVTLRLRSSGLMVTCIPWQQTDIRINIVHAHVPVFHVHVHETDRYINYSSRHKILIPEVVHI